MTNENPHNRKPIFPGTKIKAFDFMPAPDRPDCYVEGIVLKQSSEMGFNAFLIEVTKDTVYKTGGREEVWVPIQVSFMEYEERISIV